MSADLTGIATSGHKNRDQEFYTWKFPGAPVAIQLGLRAVEEIEHQRKVASLFNGEIGGVLLGRRSGCVEIEDARPVLSTGAGPVTGAPRAAWKQAIVDSASPHGDLNVVGCYMSTAGEIRLSPEDVSLIQDYFSEPDHVFLVIGRTTSGGANAGFFFWDNGALFTDFSFMEFPFDAQKLRRLLAPTVPDPRSIEPEMETPDTPTETAPLGTPSLETPRQALSIRTPAVRFAIGVGAILSVLLAVVLTRAIKRPATGPAKTQIAQPVASTALPGGTPANISITAKAPPVSPPVVRKPEPSSHTVSNNDRVRTTGTKNRTAGALAKKALAVRPQVVSRAPERKHLTSTGLPSPKTQVVRPLPESSDQTNLPEDRSSQVEPMADFLPVPVHRVKPTVPRRLSENFSKELVVQLRVSVDANGRVLRATPLVQDGVNRRVVDLAVQAAMMWTFEPARHNGVKVPRDAIIEFHFVPTQE